MARLIDADALQKAIPETTVDASTKYRYCVTFEREDVLAIIDAAPTVEIDRPTRSQFKRMAVQLGYEPVVRCKDCKHLMFSDCYGECGAARMGIVGPDDFFVEQGGNIRKRRKPLCECLTNGETT